MAIFSINNLRISAVLRSTLVTSLVCLCVSLKVFQISRLVKLVNFWTETNRLTIFNQYQPYFRSSAFCSGCWNLTGSLWLWLRGPDRWIRRAMQLRPWVTHPSSNRARRSDVSALQISRYLQNVRNIEMLCDLSRPIAYSTIKGQSAYTSHCRWTVMKGNCDEYVT